MGITRRSLAKRWLCLPNIFRMIGAMPKTQNGPAQADWERLGKIVRARREYLKLSQAEVQEAGGPSDVVQSRIENNDASKPRPRGSTLRMLDAPLQWEPGSTIATLSGGDPVPIGTNTSVKQISDADLVAEITRRLQEARNVMETAQTTRTPRETHQDQEEDLGARPGEPPQPRQPRASETGPAIHAHVARSVRARQRRKD
ncbi:immunity repressor [Mycobacterium phage Soul22]|uniref:Immunity repressor n=5 Tax=Gracegardnervirinae TaxID=2946632 RepID=A0A386KPN0_9CAUD|nr:transcriptional repressor [Mycobacterium phage Kimberlium]YP_009955054.1 transcriptional repressor [Mycobacterium phage Bubbles123]YP_009959710.1 transcriptional repressor [Mycobacterium phage MilleniumForce]YP_009961768.1 transcriptional repressor [Mycobacterium phage QuickMath]YP_009963864.1 transcriptional repressor [Mycobacterium phage Soul22]USH45140.1 immunity repressor [Mycobacterium phage Whatsapiecost]AKU43124.1 HTH DNA binding protein [Mycobacterium phage Kimberlium]APU93044.1 i